MKKIFLLLLVLVLFGACEKILDQQIPKHSTVDGNVVINEKSAEVALVGVYSYLHTQGRQWAWHYHLGWSHLSGMTRGSGSSSGGLETGMEGDMIWNTMESNRFGMLTRWQNPYLMINAANWMIKLTDELSDELFLVRDKKKILAEAHFLRFFAHFYLFRNFCYFWDTGSPFGLIYRTEPSGVGNHIMSRQTVAQSYEMLLEDLDYCIENGPAFTDIFHASVITAKAFKAKLLAMRGTPQDYTMVISLTNDVLNSGSFSLHHDHYSIFKPMYNSNEVIFARFKPATMTALDDGTSRARINNYYRASDYALELAQTSPQYSKAISDTILIYTPSTGVISSWYNAMGKIATYGLSDEEMIANAGTLYLRLAEMVILKAEAIARTSGNAAEVCNLLNPLLIRAEDIPLIPGDYGNQADLLDAVFNVLIKELIAETGIDYEASMRFKDQATGFPKIIGQKVNLYDSDDIWKCVLPIPSEEFLVNHLCIQNPGYIGGK